VAYIYGIDLQKISELRDLCENPANTKRFRRSVMASAQNDPFNFTLYLFTTGEDIVNAFVAIEVTVPTPETPTPQAIISHKLSDDALVGIIFGIIVLLLLLIAVIYLVYYFYRRSKNGSDRRGSSAASAASSGVRASIETPQQSRYYAAWQQSWSHFVLFLSCSHMFLFSRFVLRKSHAIFCWPKNLMR
jgi:hypothetical protein